MSSEDNDENISDTNDNVKSDTVISSSGGSECTCSTVLSHGTDQHDGDVSVKADLPKPSDTETHDEFMGRCMANPIMNNEFPDNDQRWAVCMTQHEGHEFPEAVESEEEYENWEEEDVTAAEYQGRKVTLNKPFRTPNENKKFGVYTKNEKGTVVIVRFGDPNMEIKRDDPKRRKAFRDRHNCASPGPKWKARYWSCKMWSSKPVNKITSEEEACCGGCATQTAVEEQVSCPTGSIQIGDTCVPVTVVTEIAVDKAEAIISASSGKSAIKISGIAFTNGYNKNKWALTKKGAEEVVEQMVGGDVTLNHPSAVPGGAGFSRNMNGDVDEAVIGIVTEAVMEDKEDEEDGYVVRYSAEVYRPELFEALESGLWLRGDYGVSIGGYGIPMKSDEDGMIFDSGFTFDHLAIVHKPAYEEANIESVEKVAKAKYSTEPEQFDKVSDMTDEHIPTEEEESPVVANEEMESLRAELILAQATIEEFKAAEAAKVEEARQALVVEATELGLKGHEDLSSDTIESLIASWKQAHPDPEPVVMEAASPASDENVAEVVEASESPKAVVSNYLNDKVVESDEDLYARCYNAWASAWNSTISSDERTGGMHAQSYEQLKERGIVGPRGVIN